MVNSSTMTLIVIVMAIYFIGMIAISWMGRKYGKNFDDFISAGRNCTTLMIIGSAVGSHIGNGYVVGGAASGAAVGLSGAWYGIGCALSYLAVALVLNHRVYKCGYISLPEILNARYGEKMTSVIFSVTTALSYIANIAAQLMAGKALFEALGFNGTLGVWVIAIVVMAYSCISGLWGGVRDICCAGRYHHRQPSCHVLYRSGQRRIWPCHRGRRKRTCPCKLF